MGADNEDRRLLLAGLAAGPAHPVEAETEERGAAQEGDKAPQPRPPARHRGSGVHPQQSGAGLSNRWNIN